MDFFPDISTLFHHYIRWDEELIRFPLNRWVMGKGQKVLFFLTILVTIPKYRLCLWEKPAIGSKRKAINIYFAQVL